jgi:hypothetical protein
MTYETDPVDLSPLDPERDPARWSALLDATRRRVGAVLLERNRERDVFELMGEWSRPILAAAAALLLLLGGAGAMLGRAEPRAPTDALRLARLSETALLEGRTPTGAQLVAALERRGSR